MKSKENRDRGGCKNEAVFPKEAMGGGDYPCAPNLCEIRVTIGLKSEKNIPKTYLEPRILSGHKYEKYQGATAARVDVLHVDVVLIPNQGCQPGVLACLYEFSMRFTLFSNHLSSPSSNYATSVCR